MSAIPDLHFCTSPFVRCCFRSSRPRASPPPAAGAVFLLRGQRSGGGGSHTPRAFAPPPAAGAVFLSRAQRTPEEKKRERKLSGEQKGES